MTIQVPEITDTDRANAVRFAVQRELGTGTLSASYWDEIKDRSLESLVAENTDALSDDVFEAPDQDDLIGTLTAIKAGSDLLGFDYLAPVLAYLEEKR